MDEYPEDVRKIAEAGHDIGNHSQNHKNMSELNAEECRREVMEVHQKVKALTEVEMKLFRPPYGAPCLRKEGKGLELRERVFKISEA